MSGLVGRLVRIRTLVPRNSTEVLALVLEERTIGPFVGDGGVSYTEHRVLFPDRGPVWLLGLQATNLVE